MSGRGGQRCDAGSYNPGNNYEACKACPRGTTTAGPGTGRSLADCKSFAGFGAVAGAFGECPIGEPFCKPGQARACPLFASHTAHKLRSAASSMLPPFFFVSLLSQKIGSGLRWMTAAWSSAQLPQLKAQGL